MVSKQELAGACVTFLVVVGIALGAHALGVRDAENSIRHLVTVRCETPVTFGWLGPDRKEPTYYACSPKEPLEVHGTDGGAIVLP